MADDDRLDPPPSALWAGPRATAPFAASAAFFTAASLVLVLADATGSAGGVPGLLRWPLVLGCLALVAGAVRMVHRIRVQGLPLVVFDGSTLVLRTSPWRELAVQRDELTEVGVRERRGRFGTRSTVLLLDVDAGRHHRELPGTMFADVYAAERAIRAWASGLDPLPEGR